MKHTERRWAIVIKSPWGTWRLLPRDLLLSPRLYQNMFPTFDTRDEARNAKSSILWAHRSKVVPIKVTLEKEL